MQNPARSSYGDPPTWQMPSYVQVGVPVGPHVGTQGKKSHIYLANTSCLVNLTVIHIRNCNALDKAKGSDVEGPDFSPKIITSY